MTEHFQLLPRIPELFASVCNLSILCASVQSMSEDLPVVSVLAMASAHVVTLVILDTLIIHFTLHQIIRLQIAVLPLLPS